jgi:hypothetical protein
MALREAQTVDEIVDRLTEKYKDRKWDFSPLKAPNYAPELESIREAAQAFDDMISKHPYIEFSTNQPLRAQLHNGSETTSGYAVNKGVFANKGLKTYTKATDHVSLAASGTTGVRNRLHNDYSKDNQKSDTRNYNLDAMNRPAYYTIVHEMGHVTDHSGRGRAQQRVKDYFIEDMKDNSPKLDKKYGEYVDKYGDDKGEQLFEQWVEDNLDNLLNEWMAYKLVSNYSYNGRVRSSGPYITETIAEAFLDVEIRGDKANEYSKKIYEILIEEAKKGANP